MYADPYHLKQLQKVEEGSTFCNCFKTLISIWEGAGLQNIEAHILKIEKGAIFQAPRDLIDWRTKSTSLAAFARQLAHYFRKYWGSPFFGIMCRARSFGESHVTVSVLHSASPTILGTLAFVLASMALAAIARAQI